MIRGEVEIELVLGAESSHEWPRVLKANRVTVKPKNLDTAQTREALPGKHEAHEANVFEARFRVGKLDDVELVLRLIPPSNMLDWTCCLKDNTVQQAARKCSVHGLSDFGVVRQNTDTDRWCAL